MAAVRKRREANFEVLRVIAIIMVLVLHYLSHSFAEDGSFGLLSLKQNAGTRQFVGQFIESFCIVAVDVWVLISGYFLSKSDFRVKRIFQLLFEIYFYTIGVTMVMQLVDTANVAKTDRIYKTAQFLFPVSSEHYSFATAYIWLYVLAPVLNMGVKHLSRLQLKTTIIGLLIWFCIIKSVIPIVFATDFMGYNLDWYITLYLIAAYIRKYNVRVFGNAPLSFLVYIVSSLFNFAIFSAFYWINFHTGRFNYYATVPYHYNFIFVLTGALGLFSFFRNIKVPRNKFTNFLCALAPFSFGIYLLHEHLEIRDNWVSWISGFIGDVPINGLQMLIHMVLSIVIVFFACVFVDWVRLNLFKYIERVCHNTKLFVKVAEFDKKIASDKDK